MQDINIKFKDSPPSETVARIRGILDQLGIHVTEYWKDSGVENCWSLNLKADGLSPLSSNGKGISRELAQASAYGEFIERLQCGLMLHKYQSIARDSALYLQNSAPDGKYMTMQELVDNSPWMDTIIQAWGGTATRQKLAKLCRSYACADQDAIWVIPYYSLFEKKYVYIPAALVEQFYGTNGCCAGNSREEAWIHALSEIIERHSTLSMLTSGKAAPKIPDSVLAQFPIAAKILETVRTNETLDIDILDFSQGYDYPVVATRIINKASHGYRINICADPILEIAIDRTLTEVFQGHNLEDIGTEHATITYDEAKGLSMAHNIVNQLETGNGLFSLDFFIDNVTKDQAYRGFTDHQDKTNKALLAWVLEMHKNMGHQIYVRNYSFLGFPSYHIIVPGFSEVRGFDLDAPFNEYAFGDSVHSVFRNVEAAAEADLAMLLTYHRQMSAVFTRQHSFRLLSGVLLDRRYDRFLIRLTLAAAASRLGEYSNAVNYLKPVFSLDILDDETRDYFRCVCHYWNLYDRQVPQDKIYKLMKKFYNPSNAEKLKETIDTYGNPLHPFLLRCNPANCENCQYRPYCAHEGCTAVFNKLGERYQAFVNGQNEENFAL